MIAIVGIKYKGELVPDVLYMCHGECYECVFRNGKTLEVEAEDVSFFGMDLDDYIIVKYNFHAINILKANKCIYGTLSSGTIYIVYPERTLKFFSQSMNLASFSDGMIKGIHKHRIHEFCWNLDHIINWWYEDNQVYIESNNGVYSAELLVDPKRFDEELILMRMLG